VVTAMSALAQKVVRMKEALKQVASFARSVLSESEAGGGDFEVYIS
jgi:hypothetical protein